jgi:hypothetical protein
VLSRRQLDGGGDPCVAEALASWEAAPEVTAIAGEMGFPRDAGR